MNEWERRNLELYQNHADLMAVARTLSGAPIIEYFGYTLKIGDPAAGVITNGVTHQGTIVVQADAYFVLQYISATLVWNSGGVQGIVETCETTENIFLQVTDTGSGGILYNQSAPAAILAGTPGAQAPSTTTPVQTSTGIPLIFPIPRIIVPHTNIKIEVTPIVIGGPTIMLAYVSLMGARVTQG